ncbi:MAG TPA: polyprenyl diphosphate synthase [Ilumatobacteraceae bacterium]
MPARQHPDATPTGRDLAPGVGVPRHLGPHVACIMDGNGRWAKARDLPRTDGHTEGEENLAAVVRAAVARNVGWLTAFGFSTENWRRPRPEVRHILGLHEKLFGRVAELNDLNVRIQWIGRPFDSPGARTPRFVQRAIRKAIADTASNTGMTLTIAFDYGSRQELAQAAQRIIADGVEATPANLESRLYLPDLPAVDVLVRTSGEMRISNFLLWQIAGTRVSFTDRSWPEFGVRELDAALALLAPQTA